MDVLAALAPRLPIDLIANAIGIAVANPMMQKAKNKVSAIWCVIIRPFNSIDFKNSF